MLGAPVFRTALFGPWSGNALWTAARAVPSLDLCFADKKDLICAITGRQLISFARASSGTYTDSAGVLRTATTNLLLQSEDFGTTWFLTSATLSANAIAAPNGTLTADQLVEAATTANHEAGQTFASPVANATYTLSCYLKAATSTTCGIRFSNGLNGTGIICSVDLTAQTATVTAGTGTATIANVGSGWFRVSLTATASGTPASTTVSIFRSIGTAGSIANSIYLWGAQLEQSSTVGEYIPTGSTINSAPRFDHNPLTGESLGLLVEEQRTNSIRNNTMVGAVAGTPGTVPTNWAYLSTVTGITTEIVGTGVSSGINYIDIRLSGTAAAAASVHLVFDANTAIAASTGQVWTSSAYFAVVSGSFSNIAFAGLRCTERASGGTFVATSESSIAGVTSNLSTNRVSVTRTLGATAAFVQGALSMNINSGAVVDITLRIGLPQLEEGATASSVIPNSSTTAAATRNADVVQITGTNFSSWYRQDEGTWFTEGAVPPGLSVFPTLHQESDGTGNNVTSQYVHTSGYYTNVRVGNVGQGDPGVTATPVVGAAYKIASGLRVNNAVTAANGALGTTDTSLLMPTALSEMRIGANRTGGSAINTTIKRLTYWPQALPGQLQAITQP